MMTNQERQQLRLIERELAVSDPRLAMILSGGAYQRSARRASRRRAVRLAIIDLLALAMIVLAAATGLLVLIFLSTLVTVVALTLHVVHRRLTGKR